MKFDLNLIITVPDGKSEPGWNCGTVGCALGLWALCGEFDGVSVSRTDRLDFYATYQSTTNRDAAEIYFDIPGDVSAWPFLADYYRGSLPIKGKEGELVVAARIRAFVAGKEAPPEVIG